MSLWNQFEINNSTWNVPCRYSNLNPLGFGAYGLVCSATDSVSNQQVAIKKLSQPFLTKVHCKRALREIKLLKHVRHDNIIQLFDIFTPANNNETMEEIYLVTNLMTSDLHNVLKTTRLSEDQIKFFTYQILRGLKYLHSANIIHRDLKPGNLTVNEDCGLRIIDFGLARSESDEMTGYVATRWYRAPEIMLKWTEYGKEVDVWSVGCILAEMFIQKTLFPGSDHVNQLNRILDVVGYPSEEFLQDVTPEARQYLERTQLRQRRADFYEYFHEIPDKLAIDLIDQMLQLDPRRRINCQQALNHPYLEAYHDEDDEPDGEYFNQEFENQDLEVSAWKVLIFNEIQSFTPPNYEEV
ncbi:mitogen-activated kinase 11 [Brachionus plicatilis]|uniref:Mitogen-activated protein kinase n=1 Tax=Brachionus plicatilis TaxID=10195 RepID=A0A3M7Q3M0_BRAPC|nr:mitogen-activated kinase 11 [Brachionus plicatilis]